jgi:Tol biopolymer transport system component
MSIPRQAVTSFLAALAVVCLSAALPLTTAAQNAPAKQQSPNGKIVFQSTQGGDGFMSDIFVMDADGKHQTRLTDTTANDDSNPVWSPDGSRIAFFSDRRGNGYEIYLMNADGSNQHPLRADSTIYGDFDWSPDSARLAYVTGGNVYVIEVAGTNAPYSVSDGKAVDTTDFDARWSPDGGRLVIRNDHTNFPVCIGGCTDLYTVNANGSGRAPLVEAPGFDTNPRWSPDGALVAYVADRNGEYGLYVINSDGTGVEHKIASDVSLGVPAWSPAGSRLAYTTSTNAVYAVNSDGTGAALLTDVAADGGGCVFWSPDGAKVAFHNFSVAVDLYVVSADGSRKATNYTKTRRDDEFGYSWQKLPTQ